MTDTTKLSTDEAVEQLTGYEEDDIEATFGRDIDHLRPTMQVRSLVYISRRRAGLDKKAAKDAAMTMTIAQVRDEFRSADEPGEPMPDEPVTAAGKEPSPAE